MFWRLRHSRSRKNTAGRIRGGGLVIQCTVDAVVAVVQSPAVDHPAGFLQTQEQLLVQKFVTKLAVKRIDIAILPRAALGDEQCTHISSLEPATNSLCHGLRTVIRADVLWRTTHRKQVTQNTDHFLCCDRRRTQRFSLPPEKPRLRCCFLGTCMFSRIQRG